MALQLLLSFSGGRIALSFELDVIYFDSRIVYERRNNEMLIGYYYDHQRMRGTDNSFGNADRELFEVDFQQEILLNNSNGTYLICYIFF